MISGLDFATVLQFMTKRLSIFLVGGSMLVRAFVLALAVGLSSCMTTADDMGAVWKKLDKFFEAEGQLPTKSHSISFDAERVEFRIPSLVRPKATINANGYSFTSTIGEGVEMSCTFFDSRLDPANTMQRVMSNIIESPEVETSFLYKSKAVAVDDFPVIISEYVYNFKKNDVIYSGLYHLAIADFFEKSMLCLMDYPGYINTFKNSVKEVVKNTKIADLRIPDRVLIYSNSIDDQGRSYDLGYATTLIYNKKNENNQVISNQSSMFSFSALNKTRAFDYFEISLIDSEGTRLKSKTTVIDNQVTTQEYSINKENGLNKYSVKGKLQNQDIDRSITCNHALFEPDFKKDQLSLVADGKSIHYSSYIPDKDINGCIDIKVTRKGTDFDIELDKKPFTEMKHDNKGDRLEVIYKNGGILHLFRINGNSEKKLGAN